MKKLTQVITTGLVIITSHFAAAQTQLTDEQLAQFEQRFAATQARLNLSEEQKTQIRPILEASAEARRHVLEKHGVDFSNRGTANSERLGFRKMRALRSDMQEVREDTQKELAGILNQEQLAEWQVIQEEQRAEFRKRMQAQRG